MHRRYLLALSVIFLPANSSCSGGLLAQQPTRTSVTPVPSMEPNAVRSTATQAPTAATIATATPTPTPVLATPTPCTIPEDQRAVAQDAVYLALFPDSRVSLIGDRPVFREGEIERLAEYFSQEVRLVEELLPGLSQETFTDFLAANAHPIRPSELHLPFPHQVLTADYLDALFADDIVAAWDRFHAGFPSAQGYITLSPAGLDCSTRQALVYVRRVYDILGMTGTLFLLALTDDGWSVEAQWVISEA